MHILSDQALIVHLCVSEFPPFHLAVWCQVKRTCCSMNLRVIVHTCNEKYQDHFLYGQVVMYWTFSEQNGEKTPFWCLHILFSISQTNGVAGAWGRYKKVVLLDFLWIIVWLQMMWKSEHSGMWNVMLYSLVSRYQRFCGCIGSHIQGIKCGPSGENDKECRQGRLGPELWANQGQKGGDKR